MQKYRCYVVRLAACSFLAAMACAPKLNAQAAVDIELGFGANHASASGAGIDNASSSNALGACSLTVGDTFCQATPTLSGLFMRLGGDVMFKDHFGAGFSFDFQPTRSDYGPLRYRQTFQTVDGIYAPINRKKWLIQVLGGIGAARTSFAYTQSSCVGTAVCSSQSQAVGNATHFAVHTGVAFQYFVHDKFFIKPEFDYHYIPGFTNQFGSNSVPGAMISVGYGSGR